MVWILLILLSIAASGGKGLQMPDELCQCLKS